MNSDGYKDCNHLLIYVSQDNEVDTIEIIEQALTDDKIVAVPKVYGDHMHFHRIHGMSDLKVGAYGILEPVGCDMLHPTEGILIVPGIVFDKNGHRIGYGGVNLFFRSPCYSCLVQIFLINHIYGCLQPDKEQYDRKQQASCYYKNQLCI